MVSSRRKRATVDKEFEPSMDGGTQAQLRIVANQQSFPAMEEIINDFNAYYPNVTITYENLKDYDATVKTLLDSGGDCDLFMNRDSLYTDSVILENAEDLSDIGLNLDAIQPILLKSYQVGDEITAIPMGVQSEGFLVNVSLLEQYGLEVPENYQEFLEVCDRFVEEGVAPIAGYDTESMLQLVHPKLIWEYANSNRKSEFEKALYKDEENCGEYFRDNFQLISQFAEKGYFNFRVSDTLPDSYHSVIARFLEGDIPFMAGTTEVFSGMEEQEGLSRSFTEDPFEYTFLPAPIADSGAYTIVGSWAGLSVNKNSENLEMANEFMRFLVSIEELNRLALTKGLPTASVDTGKDDRYIYYMNQPGKLYVFDKEVEMSDSARQVYGQVLKEIAEGDLTVEEAVEQFDDRLQKEAT
jgi:multiple sugar transport system substrate-binding protein